MKKYSPLLFGALALGGAWLFWNSAERVDAQRPTSSGVAVVSQSAAVDEPRSLSKPAPFVLPEAATVDGKDGVKLLAEWVEQPRVDERVVVRILDKGTDYKIREEEHWTWNKSGWEAREASQWVADSVLVKMDSGSAIPVGAQAIYGMPGWYSVAVDTYGVAGGLEAGEQDLRNALGDQLLLLEREPLVYSAVLPNEYSAEGELPDWLERIDAPEGWDVGHDASDVLVAVIDSGINVNHEDLRSNLWTNSGEVMGNGIDDDGNGFVDDVHGWDFVRNHPMEGGMTSHGSMVAGIIGAAGGNRKGISGVAWRANLMGVSCLDSSGVGRMSHIASAVKYACDSGAQVVNMSFGGRDSSMVLKEAIDQAEEAGVLVVAAAGNSKWNVDSRPVYPACYPNNNILSVAALASEGDFLADFSNWGIESVDLAAPGVDIRSVSRDSDTHYETHSGTSFSAPMVSGAAALLWSQHPEYSAAEIKEAVLSNTRYVPDLYVKTHGVLSLSRILTGYGRGPVSVDHPLSNYDIRVGEFLTLSFQLHGEGPLQLRWLKDGALVFEESRLYNRRELAVSMGPVTLEDAGEYSLQLSNPSNQTEFGPIKITVGEGVPYIRVQPEDVVSSLGELPRFSVEAYGSGNLSFQWYEEGVPLEGETDKELKLTNLSEGYVGKHYWVVVSNEFGEETSRVVTVKQGASGRYPWKAPAVLPVRVVSGIDYTDGIWTIRDNEDFYYSRDGIEWYEHPFHASNQDGFFVFDGSVYFYDYRGKLYRGLNTGEAEYWGRIPSTGGLLMRGEAHEFHGQIIYVNNGAIASGDLLTKEESVYKLPEGEQEWDFLKTKERCVIIGLEKLFSSRDGKQWEAADIDWDVDSDKMMTDGERFYRVSAGRDHFLVSDDAIHWEEGPLSPIRDGGSVNFDMVGRIGDFLVLSWSRINYYDLNTGELTQSGLQEVSHAQRYYIAGDMLVCWGDDGFYLADNALLDEDWYSANGDDFFMEHELVSFMFHEGNWWALDASRRLYLSSDSYHWHEAGKLEFAHIEAFQGQWIGVKGDAMYTASGPTNWRHFAGTRDYVSCEGLILCNEEGRIRASFDGIKLVDTNIELPVGYQEISRGSVAMFNGEYFFNAGSVVARSEDGVHWEQTDTEITNGRKLFVSDGLLWFYRQWEQHPMYSEDGVNWEASPVFIPSNGTGFVQVGDTAYWMSYSELRVLEREGCNAVFSPGLHFIARDEEGRCVGLDALNRFVRLGDLESSDELEQGWSLPDLPSVLCCGEVLTLDMSGLSGQDWRLKLDGFEIASSEQEDLVQWVPEVTGGHWLSLELTDSGVIADSRIIEVARGQWMKSVQLGDMDRINQIISYGEGAIVLGVNDAGEGEEVVGYRIENSDMNAIESISIPDSWVTPEHMQYACVYPYFYDGHAYTTDFVEWHEAELPEGAGFVLTTVGDYFLCMDADDCFLAVSQNLEQWEMLSELPKDPTIAKVIQTERGLMFFGNDFAYVWTPESNEVESAPYEGAEMMEPSGIFYRKGRFYNCAQQVSEDGIHWFSFVKPTPTAEIPCVSMEHLGTEGSLISDDGTLVYDAEMNAESLDYPQELIGEYWNCSGYALGAFWKSNAYETLALPRVELQGAFLAQDPRVHGGIFDCEFAIQQKGFDELEGQSINVHFYLTPDPRDEASFHDLGARMINIAQGYRQRIAFAYEDAWLGQRWFLVADVNPNGSLEDFDEENNRSVSGSFVLHQRTEESIAVVGMGAVEIESLPVGEGEPQLVLSAVADVGYDFLGWEGLESDDLIAQVPASSLGRLRAVFSSESGNSRIGVQEDENATMVVFVSNEVLRFLGWFSEANHSFVRGTTEIGEDGQFTLNGSDGVSYLGSVDVVAGTVSMRSEVGLDAVIPIRELSDGVPATGFYEGSMNDQGSMKDCWVAVGVSGVIHWFGGEDSVFGYGTGLMTGADRFVASVVMSDGTDGSVEGRLIPVRKIQGTLTLGEQTSSMSLRDVRIETPKKQLIGIATRGVCGAGDDRIIGGFFLDGDGPKRVVLRGIGPSLADAGLGGYMPDPKITLYEGSTALGSNDNWQDSPAVEEIRLSRKQLLRDSEAAIVTTLDPGPYTVVMEDAAGQSGVALVEIYEYDPELGYTDATLTGIATRGLVEGGDRQLIGGFIIKTDQEERVLIRARGPSMADLVDGVLDDPKAEVYHGSTKLCEVNDLYDDASYPELEALYPRRIPSDPREVAFIMTLPAGGYTVIVGGQDGSSGIGIVEVYYLDR